MEYEELWEPESQRYGWIAPMISGKNGVPHTIAKVENKCRKGDRILRSELLTILRMMFWKGMTVTGSRHGINPVWTYSRVKYINILERNIRTNDGMTGTYNLHEL